jgi:hypothetical protein
MKFPSVLRESLVTKVWRILGRLTKGNEENRPKICGDKVKLPRISPRRLLVGAEIKFYGFLRPHFADVFSGYLRMRISVAFISSKRIICAVNI